MRRVSIHHVITPEGVVVAEATGKPVTAAFCPHGTARSVVLAAKDTGGVKSWLDFYRVDVVAVAGLGHQSWGLGPDHFGWLGGAVQSIE